MYILKSVMISVFILLVCSGCGSPVMSESEVSASPVGQPMNPGKARIYVIRILSSNPLIAGKVKDGDRTIGSLRQNTYLCWDREPGDTILRTSRSASLSTAKENLFELPLHAEAGKAYYVMQQWRGQVPRLVFLKEDYAKKKLADCKPVKVTVAN